MIRVRHVLTALSAAGLVAASFAVAPAASAAEPGVIASGFAGPLHVAFGPGHSLYVADAFTGTISSVDVRTGKTKTVASEPGFTPGVDVNGKGNVLFTFTEGGDPLAGAPTWLMRANAAGRTTVAADMRGWELAHNPDGQSQQAPDALSNPYSVLALGSRTLVADAAANAIIEVRANGSMRTLAVFPNITTGDCAGAVNNDPQHPGCDPVPTDLELGPDGYLYVSGLGAEVEGHVYKVNATTGAIVQTWGGFPPLTGIAVAPNGTIYAASLFTDTVFRIGSGGVATASVPAPTDVEWGHGMLVAGSLTGNILRVPLDSFS